MHFTDNISALAPGSRSPGHSVRTSIAREPGTGFPRSATSILLDQDQLLLKKGTPFEGCYWLRKGVLKVTVSSRSGEERVLAILGPGSFVGEFGVVDALPGLTTVQGMTACQLTFMNGSDFKTWLRDNPAAFGELAAALVACLRQAYEEVAAATFLSVKARIARAMLQLAEHLGRDVGDGRIEIMHKIRQADLASMAGVARESVSRTLGEFKREGAVSNGPPNYFVVNRDALQHAATDPLP